MNDMQMVSPKTKNWLKETLRRSPRLFRAAKEIAIASKVLRHRARTLLSGPQRFTYPLQTTPAYEVPEGVVVRSAEDLLSECAKRGLETAQGRHTVYLPPQAGLSQFLGSVVEKYPPSAGFKILRRFARPDEATYIDGADTVAVKFLVGNIQTQAHSAACLHALGLGPRLYDTVRVSFAGVDATVMVVEHVDGVVPTVAEYDGFLARLRVLQQKGIFQLCNPSGYECDDFASPGCNGNLLRCSDARLQYVDPQQFLFDTKAVLDEIVLEGTDVLHFGDRSRLVNQGQNFLYQEIPGYGSAAKRGTQARWEVISGMLRRSGVDLGSGPALDVCCNSGMMLGQALGAGAPWGFGWDRPAVAATGTRLLGVVGAGRSTLFGTEINEEYNFSGDVPGWAANLGTDGALFFLAAWQHVGVPFGVDALPWKWLVYEGHQDDDASTTRDVLDKIKSRWRCDTVHEAGYRDALSSERPLVLLRRTFGH